MISIAMATYNGEKFLREQLDSILKQTYTDFELIICDDCSSDGTYKILEEYCLLDARIRIYKNHSTLGFKKNFEKVISYSKGELIALADQDDIWIPEHLQRLYDSIGMYDLVCSDALLIDDNGCSMNVTMRDVLGIDKMIEINDMPKLTLFFFNYVQGSTMMFKRTLLDKILPISDYVKFHDYWIALIAQLNNGIYYLDEQLLLYRQHATNVTINKRWSLRKGIKRAKDKKKKNNLDISNKIFLYRELLEKIGDNKNYESILQCISFYYSNIYAKRKFLNIRFFFRNYKVMYPVKNKSFILKILRFVENFII